MNDHRVGHRGRHADTFTERRHRPAEYVLGARIGQIDGSLRRDLLHRVRRLRHGHDRQRRAGRRSALALLAWRPLLQVRGVVRFVLGVSSDLLSVGWRVRDIAHRRPAHMTTSYRWWGCGRQADLVFPDQAENALRIVRVDGEDMGCPPSGCRRLRRWLTELWPGVLVQRRRVHEEHIYPVSPQLEGHGVPVFDQEWHTEQRQWVALTGRRGNRIERSKPKHARDPLLAIPPEVAQAAQRPLQIARSLSHPVIRVSRLHPRVELPEVTAGTCMLQPRRTQRHPPRGRFHGMC